MKIGVDICNTIADVNAEIARVRGVRDWRPEQYGLESLEVRDAEAFFCAHPSVFVDAAPLLGAREALHALARSAEIFYVTSRPLWAREITERWLEANGFPQGVLVTGVSKAAAVGLLGLAAFVEDDRKSKRSVLCVDCMRRVGHRPGLESNRRTASSLGPELIPGPVFSFWLRIIEFSPDRISGRSIAANFLRFT